MRNVAVCGLHCRCSTFALTHPLNKFLHFRISNGGVTAGLHYDLFHNTFVMLEGRKRFTLLAPDALNICQLHPSLHPGYRQSQWTNVSQQLQALEETYPMWQVELEPGDGELQLRQSTRKTPN